MYIMDYDHIYPCSPLSILSGESQQILLLFHFLLLFYKPLCPISKAYMKVSVGLATGVWEIYQWPHPKEKRFSLP